MNLSLQSVRKEVPPFGVSEMTHPITSRPARNLTGHSRWVSSWTVTPVEVPVHGLIRCPRKLNR